MSARFCPVALSRESCHLGFNGIWSVAQAIVRGQEHDNWIRPCEDAAGFRFLDDGGLCIAVGDGVGGGSRGDVCSNAVVAHALAAADRPPLSVRAIEAVVQSADSAVGNALERAGSVAGTGATMLAAVWEEGSGDAWSAHVGDARVYCFSFGAGGAIELSRVSLDHTFANMPGALPVGSSIDAPCRMIGAGGTGPAEVAAHPRPGSPGQRGWLLCSDGLHGPLGDEQIASVLRRHVRQRMPAGRGARRLAVCAEALGREAVRCGSRDDIAVLIATRLPLDAAAGLSYSIRGEGVAYG